MKILYEADDGKIFNNEFECFSYEFGLKFSEITKIKFFDINGKMFYININDLFNDKYYNNCERIYIHNNVELICLHAVANEAGWCEFESILEPGFWVRKEVNGNGIWEKEEEK